MSWGYPDGCDQNTHDRAFGELGPSPAELAAEADAQNDQAWQDEIDYPEPGPAASCPHCEGSGDELVADGWRCASYPLIRYIPCPECAGRGRLDK